MTSPHLRRMRSRRALRERRRRGATPWLGAFASLIGTNLNAGGWIIVVSLVGGLIGSVMFSVHVLTR